MTPSDIALFWLGVGMLFGLFGMNWLWQAKIRDKAASGMRLEVRGKLYTVRLSDNG